MRSVFETCWPVKAANIKMDSSMKKRSAPAKRRVVLVGGYGHRNLGDDALMLVSFSILCKCTDAREITILVREPAGDYKYVERLAPKCEVLGIWPGRAVECDRLVYGGGTMYRAFPGVRRSALSNTARAVAVGAWGPGRVVHRLLGGRASLAVYPLISADHSFALGIGVGPFMNGCHGLAEARRALTGCEYVSVRDSCSETLCRQWKVQNVVRRADLCFCPALWSNGFSRPGEPDKRARHLGVVVREWKHTETGAGYGPALRSAVNRLRKTGYDVKYVFFQEEPNWRRVLARSRDDILAYSPDSTTVEQFVDKLRQFDLIITARAHGAIFASVLGIPCVCIEIEPKLREICVSLRGGGRMWSPPFEEDALVAAVQEMADNLRVYSELTCKAAGENAGLVELSMSEFLAVC